MKITKDQLKEIIKEELESLISENEEAPTILYDKEIGHYYIDGREIVFTDKDGAKRENVPLAVKSLAKLKKKQRDLK